MALHIARKKFWASVVMAGVLATATWLIVAMLSPITDTSTGTEVSGTGTGVSAPFAWQGIKWCPTYEGSDGCDNTQGNRNYSSLFRPSQVNKTANDNYILLKMNSTATATGAITTAPYETWHAPARISEQIELPCNSSGQVENWPAFWLVTTGAWPEGGEIDIVEGLGGSAAWHYHYLNASGAASSIGQTVSGFSGCGTHTYAVNWSTSAISFYYDDRQVGQVTPAQIGVPIASGPMCVIDDYAASTTDGGQTTGGVSMKILTFSS